MIFSMMSSEDLPAPDRFDWFCDMTARDTQPSLITSPHAGDFRATMGVAETGPVQLSLLSFPELRSVRTSTLVRRSDPERYGLTLVTGGSVWLSQRSSESLVAAGDFLLYDTSQPFDSRALDAGVPVRMLILHLPKTAIPVPADRLRPLVAQRICAAGGMSAILAQYLSSIASVPEDGPSGLDGQCLGSVALDLASATLAAIVDSEHRLPPETRTQALLSRIEAFIRHNLGDPELTPPAIAARHHISLGYLHKIFRSRERTLAEEIRHQRLERCRTDLADPRMRAHPIHVICARWGFRHAADFSRAFRAAHGLSPREYRRQALSK